MDALILALVALTGEQPEKPTEKDINELFDRLGL